jgi:hypothetical protein
MADPAVTTAFKATCNGIKATIRDEITDPDLGVYFSFRTVSEQEKLDDPLWD